MDKNIALSAARNAPLGVGSTLTASRSLLRSSSVFGSRIRFAPSALVLPHPSLRSRGRMVAVLSLGWLFCPGFVAGIFAKQERKPRLFLLSFGSDPARSVPFPFSRFSGSGVLRLSVRCVSLQPFRFSSVLSAVRPLSSFMFLLSFCASSFSFVCSFPCSFVCSFSFLCFAGFPCRAVVSASLFFFM